MVSVAGFGVWYAGGDASFPSVVTGSSRRTPYAVLLGILGRARDRLPLEQLEQFSAGLREKMRGARVGVVVMGIDSLPFVVETEFKE